MILIFDKTKEMSASLGDTMQHIGVLTLPYSYDEPLDVPRECRCALLIRPERAENLNLTLNTLRRVVPGLPIIALSAYERLPLDMIDLTLPTSLYASEIYRKIKELTDIRSLPSPGDYSKYGIDASARLTRPEFRGKEVPFTKTERMILRALIRCYPRPLLADELLFYAFRYSRMPAPSSIRTHISVMNRKFNRRFGLRAVLHIPSMGYILSEELN